MGTRSTVKGYWRQCGNSVSNTATPGVFKHYIKAVVADVSAATADTGIVLPKGGRVLSFDVISVNGDLSTLDIGDGTTSDRFANELNSNALGVTASADLGVLTADTALYIGTGVSAGTGSATLLVEILMDDDGVKND